MASPLRFARSSARIVREEGVIRFAELLVGWLKGKRGQYHPDVSLPPVLYDDYWRRVALTNEEAQRQRVVSAQLSKQPFFLILTRAAQYDVFYHSIAANLEQTYPHWLWVVMVSPSHPDYRHYVALTQLKPRIRLVESWDEIAALQGGDAARPVPTGDAPIYVLFLEAGDQLALETLFILAETINRTDAASLYTDYDYLDPDVQSTRHFIDPVFKPDWSPELMLSFNLLRHLGCYRWDIWRQCGPEIDTLDFALRAGQRPPIVHIPRVLYHRRYAHRLSDFVQDAAAVHAHLARLGLREPSVVQDEYSAVRVTWAFSQVRKVSIIIPSKDHSALLERCLFTLFGLTDYPDYEVIVVDTGSVEADTFALYARYQIEPRFQKVDAVGEFNFSRACNIGARYAAGELLLFLNNDTEILRADWLRLMAQWFELPEVGIVGVKLLYPDGKIQHAGVIIGLHGLAAHIFARMDEHQMTMFGSDDWYRNYLAVTGACLMIPRSLFVSIGGFDEAYRLNYSDVELCIAVHRAGYRIVYTPHVRLKHHESATHKKQIPIEDTWLFNERLQALLRRGDCCYNPNLTHQSQIPYPRRDDYDTASQHNQIMMAKVAQVAAEALNTK